jgi:hypothetical protein
MILLEWVFDCKIEQYADNARLHINSFVNNANDVLVWDLTWVAAWIGSSMAVETEY